MWKSHLFWKLFVGYATLYLASTVAIVVIVTRWHEEQVVGQVVARLTESATLIRSRVVDRFAEGPTPKLQNEIRDLGQATGTRITLVNPDGKVLADSERATLAAVEQMDNHKNRPELLQAAQQGRGTSQRKSPTLGGVTMLYVGIGADMDGNTVGLVRTARPMSFVREQVAHVQRLVGIIVLLVSLCVVALTYWIVTRIIRPVNELTEAATSIGRGDYEHEVHLKSQDELSQLAMAFNTMSGELKKQVDQLRTSKEQVATILSAMHEGVIAMDQEQRILFANAAAGSLFGFSADRAMGSKLQSTIHRDALLNIVEETLRTHEDQNSETVAPRSTSTLELSTSILPGEPCPGVVVVVRDVSELRRLERVRQEFVGNVSHELKTPLTSIKAYAETLSQGAIDDEQNRMTFVRQIEEHAERLHQLVTDVLTLARVESGAESFDLKAVSLTQAVNTCVNRFQAIAQGKQITLVAKPPSDAVLVQADEGGVQQILDNIVENAIRYTPENGTVEVRWTTAGSMALLQVIDTGIGISEEDQPRLFERFFRVDKARSRQLGGTGLGLSIVKHLTQFFGGSVGVTSSVGEGSTFSITLPLA